MSTIYELTDRLQTIVDTLESLEPGDAEAEGALQMMLEATVDDLGAKSDDYVKALRCIEAEAEAIDAEAKLLAGKAKVKKAGADRLKQTLKWAMEELGADKLAGPLFKLALQASPPSVQEVNEEAALAAGFAQAVTVVQTDRRAIVDAWKADPRSVDGVATVVQGTHLRIR